MEIPKFNPPEADDSGSDGFSDREYNATTNYSLNWIIYSGKTDSQFPLNDMVISCSCSDLITTNAIQFS